MNGQLFQSWQEAMERDFTVPRLSVETLLNGSVLHFFSFPSTVSQEDILAGKDLAGSLIRRQESIEGSIEVSAEELQQSLFRITVRLSNRTQSTSETMTRDDALLQCLVSAHAILTVTDGEFVSLLEPPEEFRQYVASCKNIGNWPVMVGQKPDRNIILASPIILYDYPEIAPESAGDLFDSTEIDEILTLRILTLTEEEKREMRSLDERSRRILQRAETLPMEQLMKMHGVIRNLKSSKREQSGGERPAPPQITDLNQIWDPWEAKPQRDSATVFGVEVRKGDRVRLWPVKTADILDMALKGKTAIVEAIEEDYDGKIHLAVIIEDDPGKDMGELRQPGHRFFFTPEEVEPVSGSPMKGDTG